MTVLRSQQIVPIKSQTNISNSKLATSPSDATPKPSCSKARGIQSTIPVKSHETLALHFQPCYLFRSSRLSSADSELGTDSITEQSTPPPPKAPIAKAVARRRSLRLASKSDGVGVEVSSENSVSCKPRKRKRVYGEEGGYSENQAGDVEGEQGDEKTTLGLVEEPKMNLSVVGASSGDADKVFVRSSNENELGSKVQKLGKRKLSMDVGLSGSHGVDGFLNLRSGKKISKRLLVSEKKVDRSKQDEDSDEDDHENLRNEIPVGSESIDIGKTEEMSAGTQCVRKLEGNDYLLNSDNLENLVADAGNNDSLKQKNVMQVEEGDEHGLKNFEEGPRNDGLPSAVIQEGLESKINDTVLGAALDINDLTHTDASDERQARDRRARHTFHVNSRRHDFRCIARTNAARFAYVSREDENELTDEITPEQEEDWPGPFSTAMKIVKDRQQKNMPASSSSSSKDEPVPIVWTPKSGEDRVKVKLPVPSLQELSIAVLLKDVDAIGSLEYFPDSLRNRLSQLLCDSRRMNNRFLKLLTHGSPTEIRLRDCSWLTEEDFTKSFEGCGTSKLVVLLLDQSGRCMTDYVLCSSIAQLPNTMPELATLSITGACRLSDSGLGTLISSAPALRSINLSECSLLSPASIDILANTLGSVLRELYLDDCQSIDVMETLPALKKLQYLEVFSVAGIPSICDDFIKDFISARGKIMKELVLARCEKLTDYSLKVIAEQCPDLRILNLNKLHKLTDFSVGYLANGCQALHTLILCGNRFSDEAIAAFLETAGESMEELSLNNVQKVGHNTAISIAKRAKKLRILDLSWCRSLADEAVGLIVDSCLSLRVLKLFGCSQITDVLVNGHSNPQIQIIGLKMSPILHSLEVPDPQGRPFRRP